MDGDATGAVGSSWHHLHDPIGDNSGTTCAILDYGSGSNFQAELEQISCNIWTGAWLSSRKTDGLDLDALFRFPFCLSTDCL